MSEYFAQIYGIGEKTAHELARRAPHVKSLAQARAWLATQPGLHADTRADLQYNPHREIPRRVLQALDAKFARVHGWKIVLAGSYRRGREISHDLDIVISRGRRTGDTTMLWQNVASAAGVAAHEPFAAGTDKLVCVIDVKLEKIWRVKTDVFFCAPQEFAFMLLYATGSKNWNIIMRQRAQKLHMRLNQNSLTVLDTNARLAARSEREIFKHLGMQYRTPVQRDV